MASLCDAATNAFPMCVCENFHGNDCYNGLVFAVMANEQRLPSGPVLHIALPALCGMQTSLILRVDTFYFVHSFFSSDSANDRWCGRVFPTSK